uniref:Putative glucan endo-1,3-beta-glucosidase-like n=1 Tax=Davidia involucrata TaxID=16924 RepID=A0A5B7BY37_DAVIN
MRIYEPKQEVLEALKDSVIDVIVEVPKSDLEGVASSTVGASDWYNNNLAGYVSKVKIKYIVVGRGVNPKKDHSAANYVLPAINNLASVMSSVKQPIKVSTEIDEDLLSTFKGPSSASFSDEVIIKYIEPIVKFLDDKKTPLFAAVRTFFHIDKENDLDFALFRPKYPRTDPNNDNKYHSLFDWLLDAFYSALDHINFPNMEIVVGRSGWPSAGYNPHIANEINAGIYYSKLLDRVNTGGGTPLKPDLATETYLFAMYDENRKDPDEIDTNFGIFKIRKYPGVPHPKEGSGPCLQLHPKYVPSPSSYAV